MNRRALVALAGAGAACVVLICMAAFRAHRTSRDFDPAAIALLRLNHEQLRNARTLKGVYVETDNAFMRTVTAIHLMKPNFERRTSRFETRNSGSGSWKAEPQSAAEAEFSDGKTALTLGLNPAGTVTFTSRSEAAQANGGNLWLYEPSLWGFFNSGDTHLRLVAMAQKQGKLDFVRMGDARIAAGVSCRAVTYQTRTGIGANPAFWEVLIGRASFADWRSARSRKGRPLYRQRFTLWIDKGGLIRRVQQNATDPAGRTSITASEWRHVQINSPSTPADFRFAPSPAPAKGTAKP